MQGPIVRKRPRALALSPTQEEIDAIQRGEQHIHEGRVYVRRASYGQEAESEERIMIPLFGKHAARVGVSASSTRNLGDYNSAKVEVVVELPCYPETSEIMRAASIASDILDQLVPLELQKAGVPVENNDG